MIELREYVAQDGTSPFKKWFAKIDKTAALRVDNVLQRMRGGNWGDHKAVGQGIFERRLSFGPGYRIYFAKDGDRLVILFGGSSKKDQSKAIEAAQACWKDYKKRKRWEN